MLMLFIHDVLITDLFIYLFTIFICLCYYVIYLFIIYFTDRNNYLRRQFVQAADRRCFPGGLSQPHEINSVQFYFFFEKKKHISLDLSN